MSNKGIVIDKYANIDPIIERRGKRGRKCQIKVNNYNITFQDLVNIDESGYDFDELCNTPELIKDQYIAHRKYMLLNKTGVCEYKDNEEFVLLAEKFFDKEQHIDGCENLFGLSNRKITLDEKTRIKIVKDFIGIIIDLDEYTINDIINLVISSKKYLKIIKNIKEKSIYFTNEEEYHGLFFKDRRLSESDINAKYMIITKKILDMYGICFKRHKRIRTGRKLEYSYLLTIDPHMYDLMCNKHELA